MLSVLIYPFCSQWLPEDWLAPEIEDQDQEQDQEKEQEQKHQEVLVEDWEEDDEELDEETAEDDPRHALRHLWQRVNSTADSETGDWTPSSSAEVTAHAQTELGAAGPLCRRQSLVICLYSFHRINR